MTGFLQSHTLKNSPVSSIQASNQLAPSLSNVKLCLRMESPETGLLHTLMRVLSLSQVTTLSASSPMNRHLFTGISPVPNDLRAVAFPPTFPLRPQSLQKPSSPAVTACKALVVNLTSLTVAPWGILMPRLSIPPLYMAWPSSPFSVSMPVVSTTTATPPHASTNLLGSKGCHEILVASTLSCRSFSYEIFFMLLVSGSGSWRSSSNTLHTRTSFPPTLPSTSLENEKKLKS
mmetsp:Transcript_21492/g.40424  ORF Transcript_21492/g.40424 Transcript_21492/m.40424 type:complete len:232 (+) Transcript_21492:1904-2599(+)